MTDKNAQTVYIAVGANLGDRIAGCRRGVELLSESSDIRVIQHSPYYYSEPVGFANQPWFVNAVFQASTALDPYRLLAELKNAERAAGRQQGGIRFGPRVVDLDLIFYDEKIIQTAELTVPHPRMHERAFVLRPLCDIAPDLIHPVLGRNVADLLADNASGQQCFGVYDKLIDKTVSG